MQDNIVTDNTQLSFTEDKHLLNLIYDTTKQEKKEFLKKAKGNLILYIRAINLLRVDTYVNYYNMVKKVGKIEGGFKGELYIPENGEDFKELTSNLYIETLNMVIYCNEDLQLKEYNLISLLKEYNLVTMKAVHLTDLPTNNPNLIDIRIYKGIFKRLKELNPKKYKTLKDVFNDPQDVLSSFTYCQELKGLIKEHYGLRLISLDEMFGVIDISNITVVLYNFTSLMSPIYKGYGYNEDLILIPDDNEIEKMFIANGKKLINEAYRELIDRVESFKGKSIGGYVIMDVQLDKKNENGIESLTGGKIYYKKGDSLSLLNYTGYGFAQIETEKDLLQSIEANEFTVETPYYIDTDV